MNKSNHFDFSSFDLILYIKDRFWPLVIITTIGAITAIIVSLTIEEKFKASLILFPAPNTSIAKELLTESVTDKNISQFGEEEEVEKLLQVLHSDQIKSKIISKYELMKHYEIDQDARYPMTQLYREYDNNISAHRTEFMSIKIEVLDKNPEIAAKIANDIAIQLDSTMNQIEKQRAQKGLAIVRQEYQSRQAEMQRLQDSLSAIRAKGINDYESQAEVYNQAYAQAIADGRMRQAAIIGEKLDTLARYGGQYVSIRDFLQYESEQLSDLKSRMEEAKVNATHYIPKILIVNSAKTPERKAYPVRWLIVVVSTIATAVLAFLVLLAIDYFKSHYLEHFRTKK